MSSKWAAFDAERLNLPQPEGVTDWNATLLLQFRGYLFNAQKNFLSKLLLLSDLSSGRQWTGQVQLFTPNGSAYIVCDLAQFSAFLASPRDVDVRIRALTHEMSCSLIEATWRAFEYFAKVAPATSAGQPRPEITGSKVGIDRLLQLLGPQLQSDERWLLSFFEKIRNCLVHYGGNYARHHRIEAVFYGESFSTASDVGRPLPVNPPIALALHTEVHRAVADAALGTALESLPGITLS